MLDYYSPLQTQEKVEVDIQEYKVAGMGAGPQVGMGENMAAGKVILTHNRPFEIMSSQ